MFEYVFISSKIIIYQRDMQTDIFLNEDIYCGYSLRVPWQLTYLELFCAVEDHYFIEDLTDIP